MAPTRSMGIAQGRKLYSISEEAMLKARLLMTMALETPVEWKAKKGLLQAALSSVPPHLSCPSSSLPSPSSYIVSVV